MSHEIFDYFFQLKKITEEPDYGKLAQNLADFPYALHFLRERDDFQTLPAEVYFLWEDGADFEDLIILSEAPYASPAYIDYMLCGCDASLLEALRNNPTLSTIQKATLWTRGVYFHPWDEELLAENLVSEGVMPETFAGLPALFILQSFKLTLSEGSEA